MKKSLPLSKILILKRLLKSIRLSIHALFALIRFKQERLTDIRTDFISAFEQIFCMYGPKMIKPKLPHPKSNPKNGVLLPPAIIASPEPHRGLNITRRWSSARSTSV